MSGSAEPDWRPETHELLDDMRIERDSLDDGRRIIFYSWPHPREGLTDDGAKHDSDV